MMRLRIDLVGKKLFLKSYSLVFYFAHPTGDRICFDCCLPTLCFVFDYGLMWAISFINHRDRILFKCRVGIARNVLLGD